MSSALLHSPKSSSSSSSALLFVLFFRFIGNLLVGDYPEISYTEKLTRSRGEKIFFFSDLCASASPRENLLALCSYLGVLGEIYIGAPLALREQQRVLELQFVRDARGVIPFALADSEVEPVELARSL